MGHIILNTKNISQIFGSWLNLYMLMHAQVVYLHQIFSNHDHKYDWFLGEIKAGRIPFEPDLEAVKLYVRQQRAEEEKR